MSYPILFEANTTDFSTNGLGRLADCFYCYVTEVRNGSYEVSFKYPITGIHYEDIKEGRIILASHDETGDLQPFIIYKRSAEIKGFVTFSANHISSRLSNVICEPFEAESVSAALHGFTVHSITQNPFTFWTDKTSVGNFKIETPSSVKAMLGGTEGSILDVYGGGEYEFDGYNVKLYASRGSDTGVSIRYGKNLVKLKHDVDCLDQHVSAVPFWTDGEQVVSGRIVTGTVPSDWTRYNFVFTDDNDEEITDDNGDPIEFDFSEIRAVPMDLSSEFDNKPSVAQLNAKALAKLNSQKPYLPKTNLKIDFVSLWQTEEYKQYAPLERVKLCDTVSVIHEDLGVEVKAKVVKVVWDALLGKYKTIEIGEPKVTFDKAITENTATQIEEYPFKSMMNDAVQSATDLITGGTGGHVVFRFDADGKPQEILIMDTDDVTTAVNVLRININGIGFSSNGVNGPYKTAWTLDGSFVADFITAGTLTANLIKSGVLSSNDGKSFWDLDGSQLRFYDETYDSYVELDQGYIRFAHNGRVFGDILRMILAGEDIIAIRGGSSLADMITIGKNYLRLVSGGIARTDVNNSYIRLYDNGMYQFIDLNSGGNTYVRVDGNDKSIRLESEKLLVNGYTGYNGSVTISGKTLTIHNGIITGVS